MATPQKTVWCRLQEIKERSKTFAPKKVKVVGLSALRVPFCAVEYSEAVDGAAWMSSRMTLGPV
jgi:hypothetical protein